MTVVRERIPLLDIRPEFARHLTADERAALSAITLPVVVAGPGLLDVEGLLASHKAFGAAVFDGLVIASLRIEEHTGLHVLGPGDLLPADTNIRPDWLTDSDFRSATPVQLALFGNDMLVAAHRWPRIIQGIYASVGEQLQRVAAQLVICQLPRVEDRVAAILWLLAESWGHVTPSGVRLPLSLTHETLGGLVGARRPTVTLAVRKLTEDGVLMPQDSGWLLLEPPEPTTVAGPKLAPTQQLGPPVGSWAEVTPTRPEDPSVAYAEMRATVRRLREQHRADAEHTREQLQRVRSDRVRITALREQLARDALSRRRPPSS